MGRPDYLLIHELEYELDLRSDPPRPRDEFTALMMDMSAVTGIHEVWMTACPESETTDTQRWVDDGGSVVDDAAPRPFHPPVYS